MPLFYLKPPRANAKGSESAKQKGTETKTAPSPPPVNPHKDVKTFQLPAVADLLREDKIASSLTQLGQSMRSFDNRHRQSLNHVLAIIYAAGDHLRKDPDARLGFCRDQIWRDVQRNRPRIDRPELMLKHALRLANGPTDKAGMKRASKQFRALGPLFEQGIPHTQIARRLREAGGIDGLARAHAKPRVPRSTTTMGVRLVLYPGRQTAFINKQQHGQELLIQFKVTANKDGVIHAEVVKAGKPKNNNSQ